MTRKKKPNDSELREARARDIGAQVDYDLVNALMGVLTKEGNKRDGMVCGVVVASLSRLIAHVVSLAVTNSDSEEGALCQMCDACADYMHSVAHRDYEVMKNSDSGDISIQ